MSEHKKCKKPKSALFALVPCNILLMLAVVFFSIFYSNSMRASQEELMLNNFCTTVDTMRQISQRYLEGELDDVNDWVAYIELQDMNMDEAMTYIRTIGNDDFCEAHFVDMDTFEAWSTKDTNGSNSVDIYNRYLNDQKGHSYYYVDLIRDMYAGRKRVLGKYTLREAQREVISVGNRVNLRQDDGSYKGYLLLRVIPIERMKALWLFPINYSDAELGLISVNFDYVIPSYAMRSENFIEFVRYYNFSDNFTGADKYLACIKEQPRGLLTLNDSKGRPCYWYYSRLDEFEELDIVGYIPVASIKSTENSLSIVIAVAGVLLLLAAIDGMYILSINRRLRTAAKVADQASHAKTQFLSSMSHDIRTPLNAVLGLTELAQSHIDDTEYVRDCLRKISISGNHLLTLINDVLEISRVESGKIVITPAPFEVREMVSGLESITRSQTVGRGLEFDVRVDDLQSEYLIGDKLLLTQIYLNLLNNAVKYTNPGGSISLHVYEENSVPGSVTLVCVIADTGIGMSPEFQEKMYDSFTRVTDSRIDKIQGTGLGLAIVKRMVVLMNGTIDCESSEGKGTAFTVRIPLAVAPDLPQPQAEQSGGEPHELNGDLTGLNVLIAEDNELNWEIISTMLDGAGIKCERAENGRICVDKLIAAAPGTYDLVLMDIQMPLLNGRDATRELRHCGRADLKSIPIIAMTADAFAEDVQLCMEAGMDAHVSKPIDIEKVLSVIRTILSQAKNADRRNV